MKIETGYIPEGQEREIIDSIENQDFKSRFKFLNGHNGLRKGELHCLIGPKGGSKSTLARSIMLENIFTMKKVLTILSEEAVKTYRYELVRAARRAEPSDVKRSAYMGNMFYVSLIGTKYDTLNQFLKDMATTIREINPDSVYFDNFTTSFICSLPFNQQSKAINAFKEMAVHFNIPIVLIIHTEKGTDIYSKFIDGENVRGDATSVNFGSYNYLVLTYFRLSPPRSFVYIDKARYHSGSNKKVYELNYDQDSGLYVDDKLSDLEEIYLCMEKGNVSKKLKAKGI